MHKGFLTGGALSAALAVILGAFGAHFLKARLEAPALQTFETAVRYQFYHAVALLATGILYAAFPNKKLEWSGRLFVAGTVLFSGSLYGLCALPALRWLGAITPLGGVCFIAGWLLLAVGFKRVQ